MGKGNSIPVRFEEGQEALLEDAAKRSGLSKSELVRRALYLLNTEIQRRGGKVGWILDELAPGALFEESPPATKKRA